MRILLTNDDGYFATGIIYLAKKLKENGHEVYISAPMAEQSATSHALSLRHSIRIQEINMKDFTKGELDCPCVAVGGYPADCVKFALAIPYKDVKFDICVLKKEHVKLQIVQPLVLQYKPHVHSLLISLQGI